VKSFQNLNKICTAQNLHLLITFRPLLKERRKDGK
jgi:hypothetical protein